MFVNTAIMFFDLITGSVYKHIFSPHLNVHCNTGKHTAIGKHTATTTGKHTAIMFFEFKLVRLGLCTGVSLFCSQRYVNLYYYYLNLNYKLLENGCANKSLVKIKLSMVF